MMHMSRVKMSVENERTSSKQEEMQTDTELESPPEYDKSQSIQRDAPRMDIDLETESLASSSS